MLLSHCTMDFTDLVTVYVLIGWAVAFVISHAVPQDVASAAEWSTYSFDQGSAASVGRVFVLTITGDVIAASVTTSTDGSFSVEYSQPIDALRNAVDYYQQGNFAFAEIVATKGDTNFSHRTLHVSRNGAMWHTAEVPIDDDHTTERLEVIYADGEEVMLAAQHTHNRNQGIANVEVNSDDGTQSLLNASRALFSEVLPVPASASAYRVLFDPSNPEACNDTFPGISAEDTSTGFVLVAFRGSCYFVDKLQNAIDLGAAGVVVINHANTRSVYMAPPVGHDTSAFGNVPMLLVSRNDGCAMFGAPPNCNYTDVSQANLDGKTVRLYEDMATASSLFRYTKLYTSGNQGFSFSESLSDVALVTEDGTDYVDVFEVRSLPGAYIANTRGGKTSLISHNKGATWSRVTDVLGNNLVLATETMNAAFGWPLPVSVRTAPGLVVANALGNHSTSNRRPSVYISRDGGLTWVHSLPGRVGVPQPFWFKILDHGSSIMMSPAAGTTNYTYFSLDEGANVIDLPLDGLAGLIGGWLNCDQSSNTAEVTCAPANDGINVECTNQTDQSNSFQIPEIRSADTLNRYPDLTGTCYFRESDSQSTPCRVAGANKILWRNSDGQETQCWKRAAPRGKAVRGVVADPRASGTSVFMYWYDRVPNQRLVDWTGVRIDFNNALQSAGSGTCVPSDYEVWQPTGSGAECDLGTKTNISRKKQCAICLNGRGREWNATTTSCPCQSSDFACNYGYLRMLNVRGDPNANHTEACTRDSNVAQVDTGKTRLIPGDLCGITTTSPTVDTTSLAPHSAKDNSNDSKSGGGVSTIIIAVVVVIVLLGLGAAYKFGMLSCSA